MKYLSIHRYLLIFLAIVLNALIILEAQPIKSISEDYPADGTKDKNTRVTRTLKSTHLKQPIIFHDKPKQTITYITDDFIFQKSNIKIVL